MRVQGLGYAPHTQFRMNRRIAADSLFQGRWACSRVGRRWVHSIQSSHTAPTNICNPPNHPPTHPPGSAAGPRPQRHRAGHPQRWSCLGSRAHQLPRWTWQTAGARLRGSLRCAQGEAAGAAGREGQSSSRSFNFCTACMEFGVMQATRPGLCAHGCQHPPAHCPRALSTCRMSGSSGRSCRHRRLTRDSHLAWAPSAQQPQPITPPPTCRMSGSSGRSCRRRYLASRQKR